MTSEELPPPAPGEHPSDEPDRRRRPSGLLGFGGRSGDGARTPNYTLRRAAVGVGFVVILGAMAAISWALLGGEEEAPSTSTRPWNAIADVSRTDGAIRLISPEGEEIEVIEPPDGAGRVSAVHTHRDRIALVGATQVRIVDTSGREIEQVTVETGTSIRRIPTHRSLTLVAAPAIGGNVLIIDGTNGEVLDVGEITGQSSPLLFADSLRWDLDGRSFAIGDGRNFQTIVVRFGEGEPAFFPGVPMAVSAELVVTSTNVGRSAELGLFDTEGNRLESVATARPAGGLIDDQRFVYVTEDGAVLAARPGEEEPTELGTIPIPGGDEILRVDASGDGDRLIISGARFLAVVDLDGAVVFQTTFTTERSVLTPWSTWACVPVGGDAGYHSIVDLDTGASLADLSDGQVDAVSEDGCAVVLITDDGAQVVLPEGRIPIPDGAAAVHLAPGGDQVVVIGSDREAVLMDMVVPEDTIADGSDDADGAEESAVPLGLMRGLVVFVDR